MSSWLRTIHLTAPSQGTPPPKENGKFQVTFASLSLCCIDAGNWLPAAEFPQEEDDTRLTFSHFLFLFKKNITRGSRGST
jgi:hypothetical protein